MAAPGQDFDSTGKIVLRSIYNHSDPRAYWRTLSLLDYRLPGEAKPYFQRAMAARRERLGPVRRGKIVDLGCSYGVNGALLRCDLSIRDLLCRYGTEKVAALDRATLLRRDHRLGACPEFAGVRFVGLDVSREAAAYALEAGFVDDAVVADLERRALEPDERRLVADADLVISTGCIGYISCTSLARILDADQDRAPWMVHTVLRMFDFQPIEQVLAQRGYASVRAPRLLPQRRFASHREQEQILDTLSSVRVDSSGLEAEGWLYAHVFLSRPVSDSDLATSHRILAP